MLVTPTTMPIFEDSGEEAPLSIYDRWLGGSAHASPSPSKITYFQGIFDH
jgi:hypothetical protein